MLAKKLIELETNPNAREALAALSLQTALVDGKMDISERQVILDLMESLSEEQVQRVYAKVFLERADIRETFQELSTESQKHTAEHVIKTVAAADGRLASKEKKLLEWLETQSKLAS